MVYARAMLFEVELPKQRSLVSQFQKNYGSAPHIRNMNLRNTRP